jgi:hypothetical protein
MSRRVREYNHMAGSLQLVGDSLFACGPPPAPSPANHDQRPSWEHPLKHFAVPAADAEPDGNLHTGLAGHVPAIFDGRCVCHWTLERRVRGTYLRNQQDGAIHI